MPTFNTDTLLAQGFDHRVIGCQDYTLAGVKNNYAYAIVCDGCSGSPSSDVGARLLAISAKQMLDVYFNEKSPEKGIKGYERHMKEKEYLDRMAILRWVPKPFHTRDAVQRQGALIQSVIERIHSYADLKEELGENFMEATLVFAVATQEQYEAQIHGDGTVVVETGDGFEITQVSFPSGYPYYLAYKAESKKHYDYCTTTEGCPHKLVTTWKFGGTIGDDYSVRSVLSSDAVYIDGPTSNLKRISVMSDGMESFSDPQGTNKLPFIDLWKGSFDFSKFGMKGEFLKRKLNLLKRKMTADNLVHMDDISMATINVTQ